MPTQSPCNRRRMCCLIFSNPLIQNLWRFLLVISVTESRWLGLPTVLYSLIFFSFTARQKLTNAKVKALIISEFERPRAPVSWARRKQSVWCRSRWVEVLLSQAGIKMECVGVVGQLQRAVSQPRDKTRCSVVDVTCVRLCSRVLGLFVRRHLSSLPPLLLSVLTKESHCGYTALKWKRNEKISVEDLQTLPLFYPWPE